jgi:hypothetical protein
VTGTCTVQDCELPIYAKGMCRPHRYRVLKTGSVVGTRGVLTVKPRIRGNDPARFQSYVQVVPGPLDTPCHEWTGNRYPKGYGQFGTRNRTVLAHRWSYEQQVGPIPDGLQLDHLCRNPPCVNPAHLEPVTSRVNHMRSPGLANGTKTHCPQGHPYSTENTIRTRRPDGGGARYCRTCVNAYRAAWAREQTRKRGPKPPKPLATHCRLGHLYDKANTRIENGKRRCRACMAAGARRRRKARSLP